MRPVLVRCNRITFVSSDSSLVSILDGQGSMVDGHRYDQCVHHGRVDAGDVDRFRWYDGHVHQQRFDRRTLQRHRRQHHERSAVQR